MEPPKQLTLVCDPIVGFTQLKATTVLLVPKTVEEFGPVAVDVAIFEIELAVKSAAVTVCVAVTVALAPASN